jgi:uncharacterized protein Veg
MRRSERQRKNYIEIKKQGGRKKQKQKKKRGRNIEKTLFFWLLEKKLSSFR